MNILDVLNEQATRKTANEYSSACPFCGGIDRFIIKPEEGPTGRYWCRQCGKKGDAIQYLRDVKGMSYPEACDVLNIKPKEVKCRYRPLNTARNASATPKWEPQTSDAPSDIWQAKGKSFVDWAAKNLWKKESSQAREWLMDERGLTQKTIRNADLGWNPQDYFPSRKVWGLPDKQGDTKTIKKI